MHSGIEFWHWLVLGVVLVTAEIFVPGAHLLGLGLAAFVVGGALWLLPSMSLATQISAFAVLSVVSIAIVRRVVKTRPIRSDHPLLNQRGQQYVGRDFTLDTPIVNGQGKIRVDDSTWKIRGKDCGAGSLVTVVGVDGVVLQVEVKPRN